MQEGPGSMNEHYAMLAAVRERPEDVGPIYADWLEEFTDNHDEEILFWRRRYEQAFRITCLKHRPTEALGPDWQDNPETASPIDDLMYWKFLLETESSSHHDMKSSILINPFDLECMAITAQVRTFFRSTYGSTFLGYPDCLPHIDSLTDALDLPRLVEDERVLRDWIVWLAR